MGVCDQYQKFQAKNENEKTRKIRMRDYERSCNKIECTTKNSQTKQNKAKRDDQEKHAMFSR